MSEEFYPAQPEAAPSGIGSVLAQARRSQGLSVGEVAQQLKLGVRQVEALEADDYGKLPGRTIIRGFVRNYAKLLRIDAEPLLERLAGALPEEPQTRILPVNQNIPFAPAREESWRRYALLALLLVLVIPLVMFEGYWGGGERPATQVKPSPPAPPAAVPLTPVPPAATKEEGATIASPAAASGQPADTPAVAPAAAAAPAQAAAETLQGKKASVRFVFGQDSWVEIRDKDGNSIFSQLNPAGSERVVSGTPPLSLVVGNASHVRLEYNGKPVNLSPHARQDVARLTLE